MPDLIITDPASGRKIKLSYTGNPPSDDEIAQAFDSSHAPRRASTTEPPKPAKTGRQLPDVSPDSLFKPSVTGMTGPVSDSTGSLSSIDQGITPLSVPVQSGYDPNGLTGRLSTGKTIRVPPTVYDSSAPRLSVQPKSFLDRATDFFANLGAQSDRTGSVAGDVVSSAGLTPLLQTQAVANRFAGKPRAAARAISRLPNTGGGAFGRAVSAAGPAAVENILLGSAAGRATGVFGPIPGILGAIAAPLVAPHVGLDFRKINQGMNRFLIGDEAQSILDQMEQSDRTNFKYQQLAGEIAPNLAFGFTDPTKVMANARFLRDVVRKGGAAALAGTLGKAGFTKQVAEVVGDATNATLPVAFEAARQKQEGKLDLPSLAIAAAGGLGTMTPTPLGHAVGEAPFALANTGRRVFASPAATSVPELPSGGIGADPFAVGTVRYKVDGTPVQVVSHSPNGEIIQTKIGPAKATRPMTRQQLAADTVAAGPDGEFPQPTKAEGINSRNDLAKAFREQWSLDDASANRVADRWYAVAQEEAKRTGGNADKWLGDRIAAIQNGGEILARVLLKQAGNSDIEINQDVANGDLPRGVVRFTGDGDGWRAVVSALSHPDVTTGYHELGHVVRRMLTPAENDVVGKWAGAKKDETGNWQYDRAAEEMFANAVEAVETDRHKRDLAYSRIPKPFQKAANAFRFIADRVTGAIPQFRKVQGVDGNIINPDIVGLINLRFGEQSNGRSGQVSGRGNSGGQQPSLLMAQGSQPESAGENGNLRDGEFERSGEDRSGGSSALVGPGGQDARSGSGVQAETPVRGDQAGRSVSPQAETPEPVTPALPAPVPQPEPPQSRERDGAAIEWVDPKSIGVLDGMQFKKEIVDSKNGVTDQLKGQTEYNVNDGGVLTVFEAKNGKRYAIDGHHRRELAIRAQRFVRTGPDGKPIPADRKIAVQVFRASDGWTPERAKAWGVLKNLKEGKGRAVDAAEALASVYDVESARRETSKLPKSALARDTAGLVELDQPGRELVANGKLDPSVAAGVGKALPGDPARQKIALDLANGRKDLTTYEDGQALGREVATEDVVQENSRQLGFEGMDTPAVRSTAAERAIIKQDVLRRAIEQQRRAKAGLGLDLLPGESIDAETRQQIASQIGDTKGAVSEKIGAALSFDPAVQEAIKSAALEMAQNKVSRQDAVKRVFDAVIESAKRPLAQIVSGEPVKSEAAVSESSPYVMEDEGPGLFQGPRRSREEKVQELEKVGFVPARTLAAGLGERPETLKDVVRFMVDQREKLVTGKATVRDAAKAYFVTVASQHAKEIPLDRFEAGARKLGVLKADQSVPEDFVGKDRNGTATIRPEDAGGWWLGTEQGQKALNDLEKGSLNQDAWNQGVDLRSLFGPNQFRDVRAFEPSKSGGFSFANLQEFTDALNGAVRGTEGPERATAVGDVVRKLNGIAEGKAGFIKHFLGFGDEFTLDARVINRLISGSGNIREATSAEKQQARLFKRSLHDVGVREFAAARAKAALAEVVKETGLGADIPEELLPAAFHQWNWSTALGPDTPIHHHAGLYEAVALFQGAPKVGQRVKGKESGQTYQVDAVNEAKGTIRVAVLDRDNKRVATLNSVPFEKWRQEQTAARTEEAKQFAIDLVNAPRSLQSSADLSAPLRQGAILGAAEPVIWAKAWKPMIEAISTKNYKSLVEAIGKRANAKLYDESGLYLSTQSKDGPDGREERFVSKLVSNLPHVKASEQSYTVFLDTLRADVYDKWAGELRRGGMTPEKNAAEFADIAKYINIATGRGELLPALKGSAPLLNGLLFSPRYAASRLQFMNPKTYAEMTPAGRRFAATAAVKFVGTMATVLALAKLAGAEVALDPYDPNFLKVKVGDYSYDIGAGEVQYLRFAWRMMAGFYHNFTGEGNKRGNNPAEVAGRFARGKLAPIPSFVMDAASGKTFTGEKFNPLMGIGKRVAPLAVQDLWKAIQADGGKGAAMEAPGLFGVGVSAMEDKPKKGGGRSSLFGGGSSSSLFGSSRRSSDATEGKSSLFK